MLFVFKRIFSRPFYVSIVLLIALILLFVVVWLPNISFLKYTLTTENFSFTTRLTIIFSAIAFLKTNFTFWQGLLTLLVVGLSAIYATMFVYYWQTRIKTVKSGGLGLFGIFGGFLGIGCPVCGSVIFSSLFGVAATAGFTAFLPFNGLEFSILAIIVLGAIIVWLAKKINDPLVCKIK